MCACPHPLPPSVKYVRHSNSKILSGAFHLIIQVPLELPSLLLKVGGPGRGILVASEENTKNGYDALYEGRSRPAVCIKPNAHVPMSH
jgi:hypothetical protein